MPDRPIQGKLTHRLARDMVLYSRMFAKLWRKVPRADLQEIPALWCLICQCLLLEPPLHLGVAGRVLSLFEFKGGLRLFDQSEFNQTFDSCNKVISHIFGSELPAVLKLFAQRWQAPDTLRVGFLKDCCHQLLLFLVCCGPTRGSAYLISGF